jgi:hypothetical protein
MIFVKTEIKSNNRTYLNSMIYRDKDLSPEQMDRHMQY